MKRVISILLALAMIFTISIPVFASETTNTPTILTSYDGLSMNANGTLNYDSTSSIKKTIVLTGSGTGSVSTVDEDGDGKPDYINNGHTFIKSNYKVSLSSYMTDKPVFSLKYDVNIPTGTNETGSRTFIPQFTNNASSTSGLAKITVEYKDNSFYVQNNPTGFTTTEYSPATYTPGNWVTVEVKAYIGTDGKMICGVYVGDTQIFYGLGSEDYSSVFALFDYSFKQGSGLTTYMDNIVLSVNDASCKPSVPGEPEEPVEPEEPEEPEEPDEDIKTNITYFDGSLLKTVGGTAFSENELPIKPTSANISMYPLSTSTVKKQFLVKYSGCYGTGVSNAMENDNTYYVMNWSDIQSNYRTKVSEYMTAETPVLSYSYDIRIPTTDSDKWRKSRFWLSSTEDTNSTAENDIEIVIEYDDGKFFVNDFAGLETLNSKPIPYTPGNWINFEIRAYFITENKIVVGIYADDKQVYYGKGISDYTNGLNLYMLRLLSETADDEGTTVTYETHYDNIDISVLSENYKPVEMLSLSLIKDVTNSKVEAKATVNAEYSSLCLVTAVYNNKGSMVKLWSDSTVEDGVLSNVITGTEYTNYVKSGYKFKTFVFDSLISAIPQIESKSLTID